ncbi:hypothetical protein ACFVH6_08630 [Spirillospora sp. NPDC127200]
MIVSLRSYRLCAWARAWNPRSASETPPQQVTDAFRLTATGKDGGTTATVVTLIPAPLSASRVKTHVREHCGAKWTVQGKLW